MGRRNRQKDDGVLKAVFMLFTIILSLRLFASFLPNLRLWGLNHAAFIDGLFLIYLIIFTAGYYIYSGKLKIKRLQGNENQISQNLRLSDNKFIFIIFTIWTGSFYLFSVNAHFLGDGLAAIAKLSNPDAGILTREYGEEILHILFLKSFGGFTREFSYFTYQTISIISGIIFLAALLYYTTKFTNSWSEYYIFIFLNLFSATIMLFFGYIENYSITASMIYVMFLSSIAALHRNKKSIIPIVSFCFAVFLHTLSLVYLPVIIIYSVITFFGTSIRNSLIKYYRIVIIALFLVFLLFYTAVKLWGAMFWRLAFLSPFGDRFTIDNYFLLSFNHILDYINLLLFLLPITLIILFLKIKFSKNETLPVRNETTVYMTLTIFLGLLAIFFIEPKIGMARDWDIMATALIGASLAGFYLWINSFKQIRYFHVTSLILILIQISIFVPWLSINNSLGNSYEYAMSVMEMDPQHNRSGLLILRRIGKDAGNHREYARLTKQIEIYFPEMSLQKKAIQYYKREVYSKAAQLFQQAINTNPGYYGSYQGLAECYNKLGRHELALEYIIMADGLNPNNAMVNYDMGSIYYNLKDTGSAVYYWKRSMDFDKSYSEVYLSLAKHYLKNNFYDSTLHYLSILHDSTYPTESFYIRGQAYMGIADTNTALKNYHKYEKVGSDSSIFEVIDFIKKNVSNKQSTN